MTRNKLKMILFSKFNKKKYKIHMKILNKNKIRFLIKWKGLNLRKLLNNNPNLTNN